VQDPLGQVEHHRGRKILSHLAGFVSNGPAIEMVWDLYARQCLYAVNVDQSRQRTG